MFRAFGFVLALVLCTSTWSTAHAQAALKIKEAEAAVLAWERQWAATNPAAVSPQGPSWTDKMMSKLKSAGDTFDVWRRAAWPISLGLGGYALGRSVSGTRGNEKLKDDTRD
jgi:hypothetical protein